MSTARIHAELIAAFLGDDEPSYGACQCATCWSSRPAAHSFEVTTSLDGPITGPAGRQR